MTGVHNLSGQRIGQYQLQELLGIGGMSAVYHAYQPTLERHVAIKVLSRALLHDSTYLQRFMQEAKTIARLEHPHIVPIYDYGTQDDISYIVMRLLNGGTLAERVDYKMYRSAPLPSLGEVSVLLRQLAYALDYAHVHGVIHRDIKTGNVMFDRQGTAYLVDFGIAKLIHSATPITTDGSLLGTPSYMPPEQWRSEPLTPAADQYALAVLIYFLVTGTMPYSGDTYLDLMREHVGTPLPPIPKVPNPQINLVLSRALAKSPQQRFPSVSAFAQAFAASIRGWEGERTNFSTFVLPPKHTIPLPPPEKMQTPPTPRPMLSDHKPSVERQPIRKSTYVIFVVAGIVLGLLLLIGLVLSAYMIFDLLISLGTNL
jgi:serine/threonine-protein kinase